MSILTHQALQAVRAAWRLSLQLEHLLYEAFLVYTDFSDISYISADNILHPQELGYYQQLTYVKKAQSYIIGRYTAKRAISLLARTTQLQDIRIDNGFFGHPLVSGCPDVHNVQVSISHSGLAGAAISFYEECPAGVDIEVMNDARSGFLHSTLAAGERLLLDKLTSVSAVIGVTLLWSAKEALSKAIRTGFTLDFAILEVSEIIVDQGMYKVGFARFPHFRVIAFQVDNMILAVAVPYRQHCHYRLTDCCV